MNEDIVERLRSYEKAPWGILYTDTQEAAYQIEKLRKRIHKLETDIGWYKAVNAQLRDDLIEANADFQALARTPAPAFDPLDAIVLSLKREADARKHH